ncbi:hypothetical protein Tco_0271764 [Tanacetum coccineum]
MVMVQIRVVDLENRERRLRRRHVVVDRWNRRAGWPIIIVLEHRIFGDIVMEEFFRYGFCWSEVVKGFSILGGG